MIKRDGQIIMIDNNNEQSKWLAQYVDDNNQWLYLQLL